MNKQTEVLLASFGQLNRKDEYKIITKILLRNGQKVVRKEAYTRQATAHVDKIRQNHLDLSRLTTDIRHLRVAAVTGHGKGYVEFEHVDGRNLEGALLQAIMDRDYTGAISLIDSVFYILDSLRSSRASDESVTVSAINDIYGLSKSATHYFSPSLVDLNFENIVIETDGTLALFDCEWVFDAPIATDYIKTRILYVFFAKRSNTFSYLPKESDTYDKLSVTGQEIILPGIILKKYSSFLTADSIKRYLSAENIFQNDVSGTRCKGIVIKNSSDYSKERLTTPALTPPESHSILEDLYSSQAKEYAALLTHSQQVEKELSSIRSHRFYKIAVRSYKFARSIKTSLQGIITKT